MPRKMLQFFVSKISKFNFVTLQYFKEILKRFFT